MRSLLFFEGGGEDEKVGAQREFNTSQGTVTNQWEGIVPISTEPGSAAQDDLASPTDSLH